MVQLYVDGLRRGEAVAAPDGRFSVAPAPELLPGVHFITVSNRVAGIESGRAPLVQVLAAAGLTGLRFTSAPRDTAVCGSAYHYARAGVPTLEGAVGEVTFSIEGDAPPTMSVDPTSGALTWLPTANQTSDWRFELIAADTVGQARQTIDILVECPGQRPLKIGCACAEASDAPVLFAAVWWWYRSRKRRDRRCALPSVSGRASS